MKDEKESNRKGESESEFDKKMIKDIMEILKIKNYYFGNGDTVIVNQDIKMKSTKREC